MSDELRLHVDVEPLSDARVARLRSEVLAAAALEARGRATLPAIAPARRFNVAAMVSFVAAAVLAGLVTRAWIARTSGADARVATGESATQLTVGESSLDVAPRSMVLVHGDDARGIDVVVDRGAVTCEVAPRRGRPPFVVDAGEVRVRVVGTRFTVTRDGASARVHVDHGVVEVTSRGAVTTLHDGDSWPHAPAEGAPSASAAPIASPAVPAPAAIEPSAPDAPAVPPSPSAPRSHAKHRGAPPREPLAAAPSADAPLLSAPVAAPRAPAAPSPREQFESAARLEASQPERAADLYREVAAGGSAWAPNALYASARLASDRGRGPEAKRLLREYLARYPHGQNALDARELLDRLP